MMSCVVGNNIPHNAVSDHCLYEMLVLWEGFKKKIGIFHPRSDAEVLSRVHLVDGQMPQTFHPVFTRFTAFLLLVVFYS